ncbi:MAG: cyclopropane-fatty-acyl-phospholipid synthase family protein [Novosphingobium sp.]
MPGWSRIVTRILDRIDAGLASGSLRAVMPDGSTRLLGGRAPGFAVQVRLNSTRALWRLAMGGSVGWYRAWEAGEWESPDPVALFALFMANGVTLGDNARATGPWRLIARLAHALRGNTRAGSRRNIEAHYDLGNDFYAQWLDPTMSYSSAHFIGDASDLGAGQRRKMADIAAMVAGASSVLEIGCGWGSLAHHLATRGSQVTAISLSEAQLRWARERHASAGISFEKRDYRDVAGQFDAIVSVEMVEAVGTRYWPDFFDCIACCLRPEGRAALQFITIADPLFESYARSADFIQTYIFPGGMLVRESEFRKLAAERGLDWQEQRRIGRDYAETLRLWRANFDVAVEGGGLPAGFDARFTRLWRYYLMYCEGGFRGGGIDVVQVVLTKRG